DDSPQARTALRAMLAGSTGIEVVGEAGDGTEAIAATLRLQPDVVLMDVEMPVLDGVQATRCLGVLAPDVRVVAITGCDDSRTLEELRRAGATACYAKGIARRDLERAIFTARVPTLLAS